MPKSTIYFVNSINGNDENAGLSENTAFKSLKMINNLSLLPGDKVMLAKGSVFENEFLHIKNCGDINGDLIEITSYGDGDLPKINANGNGIWHQDYGTVFVCVKIAAVNFFFCRTEFLMNGYRPTSSSFILFLFVQRTRQGKVFGRCQ